MIPSAFVFENLWNALPKIDFLDIDLDEVSFYIANMDAQTYFFIAQLLLAVSSVATIVLMGYVISQSLNNLSRRHLVISLVTLFLAIIIALVVKTNAYYEPLFQPFFDQIMQIEKSYGYPDARFIHRVEAHIVFISALVMVGIIMILGGFVMSLYTRQSGDSSLLNQLLSQRRRILITLYTGAALLICGVIATYAYVRIPAVFLADTEYALSLNRISSLITLTFGISFTLSLAGGYLPTSLVLSDRARSLAASLESEDPDFNTVEWLKEQNLTNSVVQNIVRAVAILSPFLVSLSQISNFFP